MLEASGFCYTIENRPSLGLLLDILLLPCVMRILKLWIYRTSTFICSNRSWMGWILGWANYSPGSCGCRVGQPASIATARSPYAKRSKVWDLFSQVLKVSLPRPIPSGPALLRCPGKVSGVILWSAADRDGEGQLFCSRDLRLSFPNCHRW